MDQTPVDTNTTVAFSARPRRGLRKLLPRGLSGKLLIITTVFIMLTEIFVFVPSVANFRLTWIDRHFTTGEAASLALEQLDRDGQDTDRLRNDLLDLTHTEMIGMRHDGVSFVLAERAMPKSVDRHVQLTPPGRIEAVRSIREAFDTLLFGGNRIIRVSGPMRSRPNSQLEMVMRDAPLRDAMLLYARNTMMISLGISLATALLVFLTLRWFFIRPLQRISKRMLGFARDPEDASQIIDPSGRHDEIGVAEEQMSMMQRQVRGTIKQQKRLADLGLAVSKINHDLRNILASASLFSDRLTSLNNPTVKRIAPRLVRTIDRAVEYTQSVLSYGKAGEDVPQKSVLRLHHLLEDVAQVLALDLSGEVEWVNKVDPALEIEADGDQLFRVVHNLCRNAVEAMLDPGRAGGSIVHRLSVNANKVKDHVTILISDTGPGFPERARDTMFEAFHASSRSTGTGLGLAIAADLVRGHGGSIRLLDGPETGAHFEITLPLIRSDNQA